LCGSAYLHIGGASAPLFFAQGIEKPGNSGPANLLAEMERWFLRDAVSAVNR